MENTVQDKLPCFSTNQQGKEIKGNCYRIKEKESKRHKPENKRTGSRFVIYFLPLLFTSIKT